MQPPCQVLTGPPRGGNATAARGTPKPGPVALYCMPMTEPAIRLVAFGVIFLAMTLWELLAPRRLWTVGRAARWAGDPLAVRALIPAAAFGVALIAAAHGFGLFPLLGWPAWLAGVIGFVVLD